MNYLERYFYLIIFASYAREEVMKEEPTLFAVWMRTRYGTKLYELLDNLYFERAAGECLSALSMRGSFGGMKVRCCGRLFLLCSMLSQEGRRT